MKMGKHQMSKITDKPIFDLIKQHYRPHDAHREFAQGFAAYQAGHLHNPHEADSISAQAWDLGVEAAMHYWRATA
jgi:hypothetical protein